MAAPRSPVVVSPVPAGVLKVLDVLRANGDVLVAHRLGLLKKLI